MKQVLQHLRTGESMLVEVPSPGVQAGRLLIRTRRTLVSAGTERMLVEFGKAGWLEKARMQPEKVGMVLQKVRTDGLLPTLEAVQTKLDQPIPLGYCNVGEVVGIGGGVSGFEIGDRVVSNGGHAEVVAVPVNLCAKVPADVTDDAAAFTVLGAIALQGIRLAQPTLGESVVVTGLGLIGLLTVQLLRAHGCRVLGLDLDPERLALANQFGADTADLRSGSNPTIAARDFSRGRGADAVIITAATQSNEPVRQAAQMCRKRGRIVLVGTAGLELSRADFYEKELTFQVSCSYGPGRYDPDYEQRGRDYPIGFVRWTEQRNFEAVLDMLAAGRVDPSPLISHRFAIEDASSAYAIVGGAEPSLGILLEYQNVDAAASSRTIRIAEAARAPGHPVQLGVIGSGNYATAVLIPAFKTAGAGLISVASASGVSGTYAARKFGFAETTTDADQLMADPRVNTVAIATRHDSHGALVVAALNKGKHVFVEKPLCITHDELSAIGEAARKTDRLLMVGFNRRFAPQMQTVRRLLSVAPEPKAIVMTINAGAIPAEHWTQDPSSGGGRILGEACHFIDLLRFLVDQPISSWTRHDMRSATADTATLQLRFADGSIGTVHYFANGSRGFPKERLEVFVGGRVLQLDNFRRLRGYGWPGFATQNLWRQDKGQKACAAAFTKAIERGGPAPIPMDQLFEVSRVSIEIAEGQRAR